MRSVFNDVHLSAHHKLVSHIVMRTQIHIALTTCMRTQIHIVMRVVKEFVVGAGSTWMQVKQVMVVGTRRQ